MKKLLSTTALALTLATVGTATFSVLTGSDAAFAQVTTDMPNEGTGIGSSSAVGGSSLLQDLLSKASTIQVTLANTSENLASIDGSIDIDLTRFDSLMPDVTVGTSAGVEIMEPLNATIGELTTTVIGSLGDGSVDTTAVLSSIEDLNQAMTQTSDALNAQFGNASSNLGLQQVYNLSSNLGSLDASVDIALSGVNLDDLASVATTAIGSLGTGAIVSDVTNNATALTERLIGQ